MRGFCAAYRRRRSEKFTPQIGTYLQLEEFLWRSQTDSSVGHTCHFPPLHVRAVFTLQVYNTKILALVLLASPRTVLLTLEWQQDNFPCDSDASDHATRNPSYTKAESACPTKERESRWHDKVLVFFSDTVEISFLPPPLLVTSLVVFYKHGKVFVR